MTHLSIGEIKVPWVLLARRTVKGLLLISWIIVLILLVIASGLGLGSEWFDKLDSSVTTDEESEQAIFDLTDQYVVPHHKLDSYLSLTDNPPPIGNLLSEMSLALPWADVSLAELYVNENGPITEETEDDYLYWQAVRYLWLFGAIENQLREIAHSTGIDPRSSKISNKSFPKEFRINKKSVSQTRPGGFDIEYGTKSVPLTPLAIDWVFQERERLAKRKAHFQVIDTFLLLIVLGAFGSLIFLCRDYIAFEVTTKIAAYIFRPVLGMLLAVAMFILTVLAHSIVSSADILEIRPEALWGLAFAAGLLSEQTYGAATERAEGFLARFRGQNGDSASQGGGESQPGDVTATDGDDEQNG